MSRKIGTIYTVFSLLALIGAGFWFAYALLQTKAANIAADQQRFSELDDAVVARYGPSAQFDSPDFRRFLDAIFLQDISIQSLIIRDASGDPLFVLARDASSVRATVFNGRWSGDVDYNPTTDRLWTQTRSVPGQSGALTFSAVYRILGRDAIYPLVRTLLIALIAFLLLTGIMIAIVSYPDVEEPAHRSRERREGRRAKASSEVIPPAASPSGASDAEIQQPRPHDASHSESDVEQVVIESIDPPVEETRIETETAASGSTLRASMPAQHVEDEPWTTGDGVPPPAVEEATAFGPPTSPSPELPPGIELPSLEEVLGESPDHSRMDEIAMFETLTLSAETAPGDPDKNFSQNGFDPTASDGSDHHSAVDPPRTGETSDDGHIPTLGSEMPEIVRSDQDGQAVARHVAGNASEPPTTGVPGAQSLAGDPEAQSALSSREEIGDLPEIIDLEELDNFAGQDVLRTAEEISIESERSAEQRVPAAETSARQPSGIEMISIDMPLEPEERHETAEPSDRAEPPESEELEETAEPLPETVELGFSDVEELALAEDQSTFAEREPAETPAMAIEDGNPPATPTPQPEPARANVDGAARGTNEPHPGSVAGHVGLFDAETGLAWQDLFEERLTFELERAASFDQDLVVGIIRCRVAAGDPRVRRGIAEQVRINFPFRDLCFEYGVDGFAVISPNMDIDQAIRVMEDFRQKVLDEEPSAPQVFIGLSARNGRLLSGDRLAREADAASQRALMDGKNAIFALRVDPGRYRDYIKTTLK